MPMLSQRRAEDLQRLNQCRALIATSRQILARFNKPAPPRPRVFVFCVRTDELIEELPVAIVYAVAARSHDLAKAHLNERIPPDWHIDFEGRELSATAAAPLALEFGDVRRLT